MPTRTLLLNDALRRRLSRIERAPALIRKRLRDDAITVEIARHSWEPVELVKYLDGLDDSSLFELADLVRREQVGDVVHLRGLIEFSNHCRQNCCYCGLRREHVDLNRYRLSENEIVCAAQRAKELGYGSVVMQSGEDLHIGVDVLCRIIERVKRDTGLAITLSVGERTRDEYRCLRLAGADRYLLRFETSDAALYAQMRPGCKLEDRLQCLRDLRELDYQVGSGCLIGLPGQSLEMLASDLVLIKQLDLDMIGVGPFLPHPSTPLAASLSGSFEVTLRFVALLRLMNPKCHIPATTAMGTLHPEGRQRALRCGANILMPNVTPTDYRRYYDLYPNKICVTEEAGHCRDCSTAMVRGLGRIVGTGPGHSLRLIPETSEMRGTSF